MPWIARSCGLLGPEEAGEELGPVGLGDADAGVGDGELDLGGARRGARPPPARRAGVYLMAFETRLSTTWAKRCGVGVDPQHGGRL